MTLSFATPLTLAPTPRKVALIVDPTPDVNAALTRLLKSEDWEVERAVDNQTVVSLARAKAFDLIITGQRTSGPEDIELLRKIRRARPHVRLIILVDQWTPGDVVEAMRAGAFSYFCAPFRPGALADMVHKAMIEPTWDDGIEVLAATPSWISVLARCDRLTADRLVQFLQGGGGDLPQSEKDDIISAFHEILLNAMEHGAKFDATRYVELAFIRTKRAVTCRVKDPGEGFTLDEVRHAAITSSPQNFFDHVAIREQKGLRPGGFGILLAQKLVDELIYNEHGNDVLLVKYLDKPGTQRKSVPPFRSR